MVEWQGIVQQLNSTLPVFVQKIVKKKKHCREKVEKDNIHPLQ